MDERIQQALDGELARDVLSPAERSALAETEELVARVVRAVPVEPLPDLGMAVLNRLDSVTAQTAPIASTHKSGWVRKVVDWFWAPRHITLRFRPAYALTLAVALIIAVPAGNAWLRDRSAQSALAQQVFIQFRLDAPDAKGVTLAGEFTNWKPAYVLNRTGTGVWTVVVALRPGVHDYAFVVDGQRWVPDPMAPPVADGFGGVNSRVAVLTPDRGTRL